MNLGLIKRIESRRDAINVLRDNETRALANRRDATALRAQIEHQERLLHGDVCTLARLTRQPLPPPLAAPTAPKPAPLPLPVRHQAGDPPTPDRRPVGFPDRGQGQYRWYRNCYDLQNYPQDEYSEDRARALSDDNTYPWAGGHYIPGAEVKVTQPTPGGPTVRLHDPPFVQHGHPAHVSETKVVVHNGKLVRVWTDSVTPHS